LKFAHIADTHIRNLKYHKEYREVFSKLYEKLRKLEVDYIIHCGDIAHTKTQISPEFVDMCSDFFRNLADIAPTYIILGNHDGNLRNSSRQDALTPIVNALSHKNLNLLKDSGETILDERFTINVLSVFDRDRWHVPADPDRINIALYHGTVSGVKTDTGWVMESGEDDVNIFNNFDYGFLGDIHKTDQAIDKKGKIRYPGSTVQQNHGETNDKGFLLWDIQSKENFKCFHHVLENPKPFITIRLTPKGRLPNKLQVKKGARLRLLSENNLPLDVVRKAIDTVKARFKPEAVTYLSRSAGERGNVESLTKSLLQEDLRDSAVQEDLIEEYLSDYHPDENILKKVHEANKKYNTLIEQDEEVSRNINWKIKKLEWDNLFNYGESNEINFENLSGIVGILGKNFSGKSSIIDSFLYAVYNTTSKNNRKSINFINQNEEECRGYVEIDVGPRTYRIERTSKKYKKKLKGKVTNEAKTDVEFNVYDHITGFEKSLNGTTRIETDKNIRKVFGTIEDFLMTSMASQLDSLAYLNEGSTRRKEILAKFLDLELFDKKFKMCKEDSMDVQGAIKKLSGRNYEEELKEARTDLARSQAELSVKERGVQEKEKLLADQSTELDTVLRQLDSIPSDIIDSRNVKKDIESCKEQIDVLKSLRQEELGGLKNEKELLEKIENFVAGFDIASFNSKKQEISDHEEKISEIQRKIQEFEEKKRIGDNKIESLKSTPCNSGMRAKCSFVKDAKSAVDGSQHLRISLNQLRLADKTLSGKVVDLNPGKVNQYVEKYYMVLDKRSLIRENVAKIELKLEKAKVKLYQTTVKLGALEEQQKNYEQNEKHIEEFELLGAQREALQGKKEKTEKNLRSLRKNIVELYKTVGSQEEKYNNILQQQQNFNDLQEEFTVTDLFMRCMHPNGISYDIIKKRLPVINAEISKILTNIVDFEIFFENDEKRLDISIKHPRHEPRPIEMGSGAEKTIAAMAIRLALLNVSTLPKGDLFILDEPGTALDAENMEGFVRILDMIKTQFKTVFLISHLDGLKDIVDSELSIDKINGRAHVNE